MTKETQNALQTLFTVTAVAIIIFCFTTCTIATTDAAERTKQDAMKNGYVQNVDGLWRKP